MKRKCSTCAVVKGADEFTKDRRKPDGLTSQCKSCRSAAARARRGGSKPRVATVTEIHKPADVPPAPFALAQGDVASCLDPTDWDQALVGLAFTLATAIDNLSEHERAARLPGLARELQKVLTLLAPPADPATPTTTADLDAEAAAAMKQLRANAAARKARVRKWAAENE